MKTLTLADIHADPHCLDALIRAGEPVVFVEDGRAIAQLTPTPKPAAGSSAEPQAFSGAEAVARIRKFRAEVWGDEMMSEEEFAAMMDRLRAPRRAGLEEQ